MEDRLYHDCLYHSNSYNGVDKFWSSLAEENGYVNSEALRSEFRRERRRRGDDVAPKMATPYMRDVVIFDIETLPIKAYTWDTWKTNITPSQLIEDWAMVSWASKDFMRPDIRSDVLTPKEAKKRDDRRIIESLWNEFEKASILVGHNIVDFDIPKSNTRFLFHGFTPPAPYRTVDTLKILKYNFRFTYNKLGYINHILGLDQKMDNDGFPLWAACSEGDQQALDTMLDYNRQDVLAQEELYSAVRGWDSRHPNIGLFFETNEKRCRNCGSTELLYLGKPWRTNLGEYQSTRCKECGAVNRCAKNKASAVKRANLLR